ncbi:MAG: glutamine amidotransferase [Planctomycetaceae bacterium]|jgi:hypothetical protein|nr:glutamine amidotransferase [Planctomycetaceae bacterium]
MVVFHPVFDSILLVIVSAMTVLLVIGFFRVKRQELTPRRGRILLTLRLATLFLLVFAMVRPAVVYRKKRLLPATLVLMMDASESMSIPDEAGGQTRYDLVRASLNQSAKTLAELESRCEILPFAFDRNLHPLKMAQGNIDLPEKPTGRETAIGASLQQVLEQTAGKRLLGTVLFSDGTQRARPPYDFLPQAAANWFRDNGGSISVVRLGNAAGLGTREETAIQDMTANDRVFIKNELLISGNLRVSGHMNQKIPIALYYETAQGEMSEVARQEITVNDDRKLIPYQFTYVPQVPGQWKLSVSVVNPDGVPLQPNQTASRFVRVMDHGVNVLYIEGTWRVEQKFLRLAVDASPDIQLQYIGRPSGSLKEFFKPGEFAAYILGDIDSTAFLPGDLQALADTVRQGAGLLMIGGNKTFGGGGYFDTPLADILPVVMNPLDRITTQESASDQGITGEVQMLPSVLGKNDYLMRLTPNRTENEKLWKSLPKLNGINRFGRLKPAAKTIAETSAGQPILVTQMYGAGRIAAFAGDTTWRWATFGHDQEHKRFWRQMVLWLAKMEEMLDGDCWVELEKNRFFPGDVIPFKIHVQTKTGEEILSTNATASVRTSSGEEIPVVLTDENGILTGSFRATEKSGDYAIHVTTEIPSGESSEREIKTAVNRFMVIDQNLELENPIASPSVLENIATITGGETVTPENLAAFLRKLADKSEELAEFHETKSTLYDSWLFFTIFVLIFSLEWFLRKRWGLV